MTNAEREQMLFDANQELHEELQAVAAENKRMDLKIQRLERYLKIFLNACLEESEYEMALRMRGLRDEIVKCKDWPDGLSEIELKSAVLKEVVTGLIYTLHYYAKGPLIDGDKLTAEAAIDQALAKLPEFAWITSKEAQ